MFNIQVEEAAEFAQKPHVTSVSKLVCSKLSTIVNWTPLHNFFRFLEKTVSLLDDSNMRLYKNLVVFETLLDCMEKPNSFEIEYLRVHLSENVTDELARSLAKDELKCWTRLQFSTFQLFVVFARLLE
ncbi:hypothetical protein M3Y95_01231800 [Aphelenchoides besseyi]|nr:hypothetical protein M3Y95_01231800 [Aphelenchoides besseyi]